MLAIEIFAGLGVAMLLHRLLIEATLLRDPQPVRRGLVVAVGVTVGLILIGCRIAMMTTGK